MQPQAQIMFLPHDISQVLLKDLDLLLLLCLPSCFHAPCQGIRRHELRHLMDALLDIRSPVRKIVKLGLEGRDEVDGCCFRR
jgi:hypothetical protein